MDDQPRYRFILSQCLKHESKAYRDAVLAPYDERIQCMVRRLMERLAYRLAARIRARQTRDRRELSSNECARRYHERLAAIEPEWLRRRVDRMLREQSRYVREQRRKLQEAVQ